MSRIAYVGPVTYILAEPDSPLLTIHRKTDSGFRREIISGLDDTLDLPEAGVIIPLAELYSDVG